MRRRLTSQDARESDEGPVNAGSGISGTMTMNTVTTTIDKIMSLPTSQRSHRSDGSSNSELIDVVDFDDEEVVPPAAKPDAMSENEQEEQPPGQTPSDEPDSRSLTEQESLSQETQKPADDPPGETACPAKCSKRHVNRQDAVRAALLATDSSDLTALWSGLTEYADLIDDLDGVNNYAPTAVALSNRCKDIISAKSFFELRYDRVVSMLEQEGVIEDEIPETLPLPVMFPVMEHLRRQRTSSQQKALKKKLIEKLTDPEIEEIAFIANKKADGDVRNYLNRSNSDVKSFPQTGHLQKLDTIRTVTGAKDRFPVSSSRGGFVPHFRKPGNRGKRSDNCTFQNGFGKRRKFTSNDATGDDEEEDDAPDEIDADADFPRQIIQTGGGMCGSKIPGFMTGKELLDKNQAKKNGSRNLLHGEATPAVAKGFVNPLGPKSSSLNSADRITNVEDMLVQRVLNEIVVPVQNVSWDDIAGLNHAKERIKELVVMPLLRPDLFRGIRAPSKGLLLFGPPGTGKSMIGKCIASQSNSTFFSMSSSSLTSKWIGEGEKMVRAMFAVARNKQPSVIFIDEIDSLLCQRSGQDHEASTRLKTEFLMQFEGVGDTEEDKLLVVGATNRPEALDEAARRRFSKRLMIGLPDEAARTDMVVKLMKEAKCALSQEDFAEIAALTDGYSGSDMKSLCKEAAMGPIRSALSSGTIDQITSDNLRPVDITDFRSAVREVKASVSPGEVVRHEDFNRQFGALHM